MNLTTFDASNMVTQRKGDATIFIARSTACTLSKAAVAATGYGGGDLIALHQDNDNPEDWYISLAEQGFELRAKDPSGSLAFNNAAMANTFLDALGIEEKSASFLIAGTPEIEDEVSYWAILTSRPIIKTRKSKKK